MVSVLRDWKRETVKGEGDNKRQRYINLLSAIQGLRRLNRQELAVLSMEQRPHVSIATTSKAGLVETRLLHVVR